MPLIPPGVAFRHSERERQRLAVRHGYDFGPRKCGDDDTAIDAGRRRIATFQIAALCRDHGCGARVQRALVDGVDSLRVARITQTRAS